MAIASATTGASAPEYTKYSNSVRLTVMAAVMMGTLMEMIDTSIVNVAVPTLQGNLGATLDEITWVSTGYILASVIMLPMTGWLSQVFGRRRYLAGSMLIFTVASFFCGTAHSLAMLVFFRIIQGVGGAALMSTAQATLMEIFPPRQIPMAQAIYGMCTLIGPSIGPTLGGWIIDTYTWRWIFFINVPLGIAASILTLTYLRDSGYARKAGRIDLLGIFLLAVGLGSLQTMLEKGTRENWFDSMLIVRLAIAAALGIGFFIWWELRVKQPVVNLRVLRHRGFAAGTLFAMVLGFALYGGIFVLPVFLQELRNYTPMQTGIIMLPGALSAGAMMPFAARLTSRVSPRFMVLLGLMGTVGTMLMFHHLTLDSGPEQILLPMILRGLCMGLLFLPLILITLSGLKGLEIAQGTAFFNLSRQMGGSIGIAYLSTFLLNRTSFHYDRLREGLTVYNPITTLWLHRVMGGFMAHGSPAVVAKQQALGALAGSVFTQASILSYDDIFGLMAVLLVLAMPLLLLFERGKKMRERMHAPAE